MKTILIKRNFNIINVLIPIGIYVFGKKINQVKNNQEITISVEDNSVIDFKYYQLKSKKLSLHHVVDNSRIILKPNISMILAALILMIYFILQLLKMLEYFEFKYNFILLGIALCIIVYHQIYKTDDFFHYTIQKPQ